MRMMDIWMLGLPAAMAQARKRKQAVPQPVETPVAAQAFPVVLNMSEQDKCNHAMYRLGAIERHIAQTPHIVTERRMAEFVGEAMEHLGGLLHHGHITQAEADDHLRRIRKT